MPDIVKIDATGATAASVAENQAEVFRRLRGDFGEDLADSPQTPQGQLAGLQALRDTEIGEAVVRSAIYGSSVDDAQGTHLDAHGSLLDVRRQVATRSRVTATLTGVAGTGVPTGSRARTTDGDEFRTLADAVLSPTGVSVELEAVEEGPVAAPANTLTRIVTVLAGWESITNPQDAAVGVARQGDDDYRASYEERTAHSSVGPIPALRAALWEAGAGLIRVEENNTDATAVFQEWAIRAHSLFVIAQTGSDGDIRRSIENHRGMGVGTMTAISGGAPDDAALTAVTNGTVTWNQTDYTGLNLSAASSPALKAAALTTLLDGTGVTVSYIDGRYVAIYAWMPSQTPAFGQAVVEEAFGLDPAASDYPAGPYVRPRERSLVGSFTMTRRAGFPADGLAQVREAVLGVVAGYRIGEELWANDLLAAAERVYGTRITLLSIQHASADVSGVAVPLDNLWTLATSNLTITVA